MRLLLLATASNAQLELIALQMLVVKCTLVRGQRWSPGHCIGCLNKPRMSRAIIFQNTWWRATTFDADSGTEAAAAEDAAFQTDRRRETQQGGGCRRRRITWMTTSMKIKTVMIHSSRFAC